MKVWISEYIFNHPWETVSLAAWRKYPNPHKPEIMGIDILERSVKSGVLHSQRLIASRFGLPGWSRKLLGSDDICYGYEKSQVDPLNKIMRTQTKNITFASTVTMGERITYRPAPPSEDGVSRTMLVQESSVQVHGMPFTDYLEDTILSSITRNCYKGREAMEWIITKIENEGTEQSDNSNVFFNKGSMEGTITQSFVDEMADQAMKSVDVISGKALISVDEISEKAKASLKSVDEISGKAMKSVDEISEKALQSLKSVELISEKALKSVDEISEIAIKSVDEISEKAKSSLKSVDQFSEKALRSYQPERTFDEIFNIYL